MAARLSIKLMESGDIQRWKTPLTFSTSVWEGLCARADTCQYHCFSMAYPPGGYTPPVEGSRHAPILVAASSALLQESTMRDRRTVIVIPFVTLRL